MLDRRYALMALLLALGIAPMLTVGAQVRSQSDARPVALASQRKSDIAIDGRLDDAAWANAQPIDQFVQQDPAEGSAATQRTEIRVLFDDGAIYVGARMFDTEGARGVRAVLARRDQLLNGSSQTSDKIIIAFDTYSDHNNKVQFELNPLGVKGDDQNDDSSYDPVWEGASHVDSLGWTAEFRIPYSQLRFSRQNAQTWGMQVWRKIDRLNEVDMWAFWRKNEAGGPAYFGSLGGIVVDSRPRQVEIVPYVTSRGLFERVSSGNPYRSSPEMSYRAGGDLKVNLTSNLTLNATVNPDFGQVEVDPAVVNLSVFETTFAEKRPFFISNAEYFSFGGLSCINCSNVSSLSLLYRRRIGRSPQLAGLLSSNAQYVDVADATTILGAAKVTGRTSKGLSIGLLDAVTNRETARFRTAGDTNDQSMEVEPLTNYFVGRIRKDLRGGSTRIGAIGTMVNRDLRNDAEEVRLRASAQVVGFDIEHRWKNRAYSFVAQTAFSNIAGDSAAINRAQRASARYYQRPDRDQASDGLFSTRYDPTRTGLQGYALKARLAKETGNWQWDLMQNWRSPGFEVNDAGVLGQADYKWMLANVLREWTVPGSWYRKVAASVGAQQQLNFDGDRNDVEYHSFISTTFKNYMRGSLSTIYHPSTLDERLTRGGPTVVHYGYNDINVSWSGDQRARTALSAGLGMTRPVDNSETKARTARATATIKPSSSILFSVSPSYEQFVEPQQFVTGVNDTRVAAGFNGRRYVFAALDQRTASLDMRLNTTFTPDLTLELFAQPFLSSGKYSRFREFAATRSKAMDIFGEDNGSTVVRNSNRSYTIDPDGSGVAQSFTVSNPDFNVRSLRGTAVVRWEYRPGSTLFFVWTQQREGSASFGDFDFNRERSALFRAIPTNVFQVKATYWIGR